MIGDKSNLGKDVCGIESTIADVQSPALVGTNWEYYTAAGQWIKANPGDISVINDKGKHTNYKYKGKKQFLDSNTSIFLQMVEKYHILIDIPDFEFSRDELK